MIDPAALRAHLQPVAGTAAEVEASLRRWLDADEPWPLWVRTSGSTGTPKDVALSAAALRASAAATLERLGGPGQWVLALPAHYVAGLQVIVRSVLADTSPVLLGDDADLAVATDRLSAERRYLAVVPTQLHRFLASDAQAAVLSTYDAVLVGGSAVAPDLLAAARSRGVQVVTTYGMSETCGGCVYDGLTLEGVTVRIGDEGRVRIGGPVLFDGYVGRSDLTSQVLQDGWFHTRDVGRLDADGRLEVLGRLDDVAVSGGVNVPMPTVQRRIEAMPGVARCAVVAVPDPEWGERVTAVVTTADGSTAPDLAAIRDFVGAEHPRTWAPRSVLVVQTLPMLESGKPDTAALRRLAAESSDSAPRVSPQVSRTHR